MANTEKTATRKRGPILPYRALFHDKLEGMVHSAYIKLTRSLKRRPGGRRRWIFDQAAVGNYRPWRSITEPIDLAIEAGAPLEDVMPIADAIAAYIRAHYPESGTLPIKDAIREEAHAGAEADRAQADAAADPTPANLERVVETTRKHERAADVLLLSCGRALQVVRT